MAGGVGALDIRVERYQRHGLLHVLDQTPPSATLDPGPAKPVPLPSESEIDWLIGDFGRLGVIIMGHSLREAGLSCVIHQLREW